MEIGLSPSPGPVPRVPSSQPMELGCSPRLPSPLQPSTRPPSPLQPSARPPSPLQPSPPCLSSQFAHVQTIKARLRTGKLCFVAFSYKAF